VAVVIDGLIGELLCAGHIQATGSSPGTRRLMSWDSGLAPFLHFDSRGLRKHSPSPNLKCGTLQQFAWVNDLDYEGHNLSPFECREQRPDGEHYFAWVSDIPMGCRSVVTAENFLRFSAMKFPPSWLYANSQSGNVQFRLKHDTMDMAMLRILLGEGKRGGGTRLALQRGWIFMMTRVASSNWLGPAREVTSRTMRVAISWAGRLRYSPSLFASF